MNETLLDRWFYPHGFCLGQFDPSFIILSDAGNALTALAYMLLFPFCAVIVISEIKNETWTRSVYAVFTLGVAFVYLCGLSHVLDLWTTHAASYVLYLASVIECVLTGLVSIAFCIAVFVAGRKAGLRLTVNPRCREAE